MGEYCGAMLFVGGGRGLRRHMIIPNCGTIYKCFAINIDLCCVASVVCDMYAGKLKEKEGDYGEYI